MIYFIGRLSPFQAFHIIAKAFEAYLPVGNAVYILYWFVNIF